MMTPLLRIESDSTEAQALLTQIGTVLHRNGATWQPELRCEVRQGGMRLLADADGTGPLIIIPTELLVPVDGARWDAGDTMLRLDEAPPNVTPVQLELLHLMTALFNATDKLRWWSAAHPKGLVKHNAAVAGALENIRPGGGNAEPTSTPAEGFLKTRVFGWRTRNSLGAETARTVLMPIIDLLNHHRRGATYVIRDGAMRIEVRQPDGSGECFAHYGFRRDLLDFALHYGHLDSSTPFAHCAPIAVDVDGVGRIRVERVLRMAPPHRLDPPQVTVSADELRLSHVCCHREHPERSRGMLQLALQGVLLQRGYPPVDARQLAERAIGALGEENRTRLAALAAAARGSAHPAATLLAAAAEGQARIIAAVLGH